MSRRSIFVAAGGTGGHIFPALAVSAEFLKRNIDVVFIGSGKDIERKLLDGKGCQYEFIDFTPITGKGIGGIFKAALKFPLGLLKAFSLINRYRPIAIIGFGGYPSVIPILASAIRKIKVYIQEQNVKVGAANRILSVFSKQIFAVHGARGFLKANNVKHISNPVRDVFLSIPEWKQPQLGNPIVLLIVGGSQGAIAINTAVIEALELLSKHHVQVIHQTGNLDYDRCFQAYNSSSLENWQVVRFIDDIAGEYSKANIVVCRAGAMTVAEIVAAGRPAIFVPLTIAKGHQRLNATWVAEAGGAIIIDQTSKLGNELAQTLKAWLEEPMKVEQMAQNLKNLKNQQGNPSSQYICEEVLSDCNKG